MISEFDPLDRRWPNLIAAMMTKLGVDEVVLTQADVDAYSRLAKLAPSGGMTLMVDGMSELNTVRIRFMDIAAADELMRIHQGPKA